MKITTTKGTLELTRPLIMGILNLTPDSFYDGGRYTGIADAERQTERMLEEGADIIDVGAASSRPGSVQPDKQTEADRLIPVLKSLTRSFPRTIFSVDTFRLGVARKAMEAGACIINDISGGTMEPELINWAARQKIPYVVMHMKGNPASMQVNPVYRDVVAEVEEFFIRQINRFKEAGMEENIILDPGFGFGKTVDHNYQLLHALPRFRRTGYPILIGLSRKSMINKILNTTPDEALNGTTVLNTIGLLNGADILRVHDVKQAAEAIQLTRFYQSVSSGKED
ncbi:MAG: dihydropteroate synthase [Bacteroidales bacterium]